MSDSSEKKSPLSIFEQISPVQSTSSEQNGYHYPSLEKREGQFYREEEGYSFTDEIDHEVLMHRDAHFGADFEVMLAYYRGEHIGIHPDFDLERIDYLARVEKQLSQNLAPLILTGSEAERVMRARDAYEKLKEIYEFEEKEISVFPRLLADLILTESEDPAKEIEAIVSQQTHIVPELLQIIKSNEAYDPLFPGYGHAPYFAILCLGKIKDPCAIIPLFEVLGRDMLFDEEIILYALREIGEPAKQFLFKVLKGRPLTQDTIHAAFALSAFSDQPEAAIFCFEQLQDNKVIQNTLLRSYLLNSCEQLQKTSYQESFAKMVHDCELPSDFRQEVENMIQQWK